MGLLVFLERMRVLFAVYLNEDGVVVGPIVLELVLELELGSV
jgi:hypothetical protein